MRLSALQPEPLVPEVLGVEEPLEGLGLVELAQRAEPLLPGQLRPGRLHPLLDPRLLRRLLDVHVLDAGGPAVRIAQVGEGVAQLHHLVPAEAAGGELAVEVPDGEPVAERVELGVELGRLLAKRVEVGDEVAAHPVHVDDLEDPALLLRPVRAPDRRVVVDRPAGRV